MSQKPNMGCVVHRKNAASGALDAKWIRESGNGVSRGSGMATGTPGPALEGEYVARYLDERGADAGVYEMLIRRDDDAYRLEWREDGRLAFRGIGILSGDALVAGWERVPEDAPDA